MTVWCLVAAERNPCLFLCWSDDVRRFSLLSSMHNWALFSDLCTWPTVGGRPWSMHHCCVCALLLCDWLTGNSSSCISSSNSVGWLDKIDQTSFLDQCSVWDLICINFSSDNKHSIWSLRSLQNSVWSSRSDQISGLRPNLLGTNRSNRQLRNTKIQSFAANL